MRTPHRVPPVLSEGRTRREGWRWLAVLSVVAGVGVLALIGLYVVAAQIADWIF